MIQLKSKTAVVMIASFLATFVIADETEFQINFDAFPEKALLDGEKEEFEYAKWAQLAKPAEIPGVKGGALEFSGEKSGLFIAPSAFPLEPSAPFTLSFWMASRRLGHDIETIIGTVDVGSWSVIRTEDHRVAFYSPRDKDMRRTFVRSKSKLALGNWHHVAVVRTEQSLSLYFDGRKEHTVKIESGATFATDTPVTIGLQGKGPFTSEPRYFDGALDELRLSLKSVPEEEIIAAASIAPPAPLAVSLPRMTGIENVPGYDVANVWTLPNAKDIAMIEGVRFSTIKKWEPETDEFVFLHGVGLSFHKGKLYSMYGHNKVHENTPGELARYSVSDDLGKTWSAPEELAGYSEDRSSSHGVFHSHEGQLWAFPAGFYGKMKRIHMQVLSLDEETGEWTHHGNACEEGFWPLQEPILMENGNFIMAGLRSVQGFEGTGLSPSQHNLPAVAISNGKDLTSWKLTPIPISDPERLGRVWGESSIIVDGPNVTVFSRWSSTENFALTAESPNFGEDWTPLVPTNIRMASSKPAAGILSNGRRYLIANAANDNRNGRSPLTILYSEPGEKNFTRVKKIRDYEQEGSTEIGSQGYPCAVEHEGSLYVGYSVSGGRSWNRNSAEIAVFPITSLE